MIEVIELLVEALFYPRLWAGIIFGSMIGAIISYFIFGHFEWITIGLSAFVCCIVFSVVLDNAVDNKNAKDN